MTLQQFYNSVLIFLSVLAVLTFLGTYKKANPYGRFSFIGQKGLMPARPAWLLFESPQWWAFAVTFWFTARSPAVPAVVLFCLWQSHYIYRAIIYPLRRNDQGKSFPLVGVVFGILFNALNGFANGYAVAHAPHLMNAAWFSDPRFSGGLLIAVSGWLINFHADSTLIKLRADGSTGYRIPHGGMFRWVSGANYFGEILLWSGWAVLSWTPAGLVFAVFTISNLAPRAVSYHRWYQQTFPDYPKERKALIPGLL